MKTNLVELIAAYKKFLAERYPDHVGKYESIEKSNPDGAKFEAACYTILRSRGLRVEIGDIGTSGGADFICTGVNCGFVVEATTINTLVLEDKTGMKHNQADISGGWYSPYPTLYQKLIDKVKQVAKYDIPRMVSIGSFHNESLALFRHVMADEYLAVFFTRDSHGRLLPEETLKDISAFTLVAFGHDGYSAMGFLNPAPSCYLGIQFLPDIWFRQMTQRGLADGTLSGEWISTNAKGQQSFEYSFEMVL